MVAPSPLRSMPRRCAPACALLLVAVAAPLAALPAWRIDPTHSRVLFEVSHAGFSDSLATVSGPTGTIRFDPEGWAGASVEVEMPLATLDFGDADWNRTMQGRRWFDVARHPVARFVSTGITPIDADHAQVAGTLTLKDRSLPVVLEVRRNAVKRHPLTLRRTAGFSATATLDRSELGLDAAPSMIGSEVRVRIEIEATRARRRAGEPPFPDTDPGDPDADPQHP